MTRPLRREDKLADSAARLIDVPELLAACLAPHLQSAGGQRQLTIRVTFTREGGLIGAPRVTYVQAPPEEAARLRLAAPQALAACAPYRFTAGLGRAIAGRPFAIRYIFGDARN
jgi:hypothetical protein